MYFVKNNIIGDEKETKSTFSSLKTLFINTEKMKLLSMDKSRNVVLELVSCNMDNKKITIKNIEKLLNNVTSLYNKFLVIFEKKKIYLNNLMKLKVKVQVRRPVAVEILERNNVLLLVNNIERVLHDRYGIMSGNIKYQLYKLMKKSSKDNWNVGVELTQLKMLLYLIMNGINSLQLKLNAIAKLCK